MAKDLAIEDGAGSFFFLCLSNGFSAVDFRGFIHTFFILPFHVLVFGRVGCSREWAHALLRWCLQFCGCQDMAFLCALCLGYDCLVLILRYEFCSLDRRRVS